MVFCNKRYNNILNNLTYVTILILVDGFLQYAERRNKSDSIAGHNPYFSRWFSAIKERQQLNNIRKVTILILVDGFLQYQIQR